MRQPCRGRAAAGLHRRRRKTAGPLAARRTFRRRSDATHWINACIMMSPACWSKPSAGPLCPRATNHAGIDCFENLLEPWMPADQIELRLCCARPASPSRLSPPRAGARPGRPTQALRRWSGSTCSFRRPPRLPIDGHAEQSLGVAQPELLPLQGDLEASRATPR